MAGTFDYNGFNPGAFTSLTGEGVITNTGATAQVLSFNSAVDKTLDLSIQGNLALVKSGINTLTLTSAATHTGRTTVNSGTIALDGAGAITASQILLKTGTTLDISNVNLGSTSVKDFLTSGGGFVQMGGNTLVITAASGVLTSPPGNPGSPAFIGANGEVDVLDVTFASTLVIGSSQSLNIQNWESIDRVTITGNDLNNRIHGTSGNDVLNGGAFAEIGINGNDRLYGNDGNDRLVGGNGL